MLTQEGRSSSRSCCPWRTPGIPSKRPCSFPAPLCSYPASRSSARPPHSHLPAETRLLLRGFSDRPGGPFRTLSFLHKHIPAPPRQISDRISPFPLSRERSRTILRRPQNHRVLAGGSLY